MTEKLAIHGGTSFIRKPFAPFNTYGEEELAAAAEVIRSGQMSKFLGAWHPDFYGGPKVREFEAAWGKFFNAGHTVAVNSATSGLIAAVGAIGIEPGDEVIVSPWTMCASATAILVWNAIPVFADIEPETFNLSLSSIERNLSPRTRAILVTNIFGHPAELEPLRAFCDRRGLKLIEDNAQAPGALYHGRYAGTIGDIGVFSLNYHKHVHTGEGGLCVTADARLAERMQLIRNHAEAVVAGKEVTDLTNLIGFNFRLGEVEAAIGIEQLKKLPEIACRRAAIGRNLIQGLSGLDGLKVPTIKPECTHVFYIFPLVLDPARLGVSRETLARALEAEGVPKLLRGYVNVHRLPLYQKRIAYGKGGFPWVGGPYRGKVSYEEGICPVAESMHDENMTGLLLCHHAYTDEEQRLLAGAFRKVWAGLDALRAKAA